MGQHDNPSRDFWRAVLLQGGFNPIPRWTIDPVPGLAVHEAALAEDVLERLQALSGELSVPFSSVLLAAHVKVLAALTGEADVATGFVWDAGAKPLVCRVGTDSGSWRNLLLDTHRIVSQALTHKHFSYDRLRRELNLSGPSFETVFNPRAGSVELAADTAAGIDIDSVGDRLVLRLRYRTDVLDADAAQRVVDYHLTACRLIAADPNASHQAQSLVSAEERRFQIEGFAGPTRELPAQRFHELFEQQVLAGPTRVAAVQGDTTLTYDELNARANRLARALLARGLRAEGVVGVVAERNLDWMTAVLAIFKSGGAYLPIEPHFPADRIAATLARAGCALVLTERASTSSLDEALPALPGLEVCFLDHALAEDHADTDLGVRVAPDQLAYIYFTSGSTGEPKGAMCEQAGMLNHLFAKIDDLGITEGQVVAQTAPQCFDISLWQLVSALLVGGQTLIVEQGVILDVQRFVDTVIEGRVAVLQVVPSYLEVVLTHLEQHPRELSDLRVVSVTGEAVKKELTQRWFAAEPSILLVNAYGLTETSDDTNHEVMDRVPSRERVPLGPPINNVYLYIVDDNLSPVPLGAPGEIVFSGICVGRGYINDPDRTRLAYHSDPHRQGQRLYRSGDFGRWMPDGKLEFLGRRDSQVKISGFRIEIGEIENALLSVPGVRDGAVVVAERPDNSKQLVAFYSCAQPLETDALRDRLAQSLPPYMVPPVFHWQQRLPLTANSKIDRKKLRSAAASFAVVAQDHHPPRNPTEHRLAAAWSSVLGIPQEQIGRRDHFFDRGGSSLSAVKLALALNRVVSLKDITRNPVLADLANVVDGGHERRSGLLQPLSESGDGRCGALVCFPYAGGNAVNFQPMASALRDSGLAVYAVELPGHDIAAENEPFVALAQVVDQVVDEVARRGLNDVLLWGHSSGAAFAVEAARKLQARGVDVRHVFLGAQLIGTSGDRRAAAAELRGRSNAEIAAGLSSGNGYTPLREIDQQRAEHIGAAYRHDCLSAHSYLSDVLDAPPRAKLAAMVTVVVAADDMATIGYADRYLDWELVADRVDLHELVDGGHYFLRTRPSEAAIAVLRSVDLLPST